MDLRRFDTLVGLALFATAGTVHAWDLKLSENHTIQFHGFASQGFLLSSDYNYIGDSSDGSFEFTEIGLNAAYSPFPRTRIAVQGFAFDAGKVGNLEPFLDYASIEYTFNDRIGIRAGRLRRPSGIYNHIQDLDLARTFVLLPQGLYDARWRDFYTQIDGGTLFGSIPLSKAGSLSYEVYYGVVRPSEDGGVAKTIESTLPPPPLGSLNGLGSFTQVGGQLWWQTPLDGLRVGASFGQVFDFNFDLFVSPMVGGPGDLHSEANVPIQQYSVEYLWGSWTFQAEYLAYNILQRDYIGGSLVDRSRRRQEAWYVGAAYRFNSWLEAGAYYTEIYTDSSDRSGSRFDTDVDPGTFASDGFQKDVALALRFDLKDWWILKLEGHYIRGTALLQNNADNPSRNDDGWFLFAAKTTFSF